MAAPADPWLAAGNLVSAPPVPSWGGDAGGGEAPEAPDPWLAAGRLVSNPQPRGSDPWLAAGKLVHVAAPPASWAGDTGGAPEPPASDLQGGADNARTIASYPEIAGRSLVSGLTGLVSGVPATVESGAEAMRRPQATDIMRAEAARPMPAAVQNGAAPPISALARGYEAAGRQGAAAANARAPLPMGPVERGASAARRAVQGVGSSVENAIPAPLPSVANSIPGEATSLVAGSIPLIGATILGGPLAGAAAAWSQGIGQQFQASRAAGASRSQAAADAIKSGTFNAATMTLPGMEWAGALPSAAKSAIARFAGHVALGSGMMMGLTAAQKAYTNFMAGRPLSEGMTAKDFVAAGLAGGAMGTLPGMLDRGAESPGETPAPAGETPANSGETAAQPPPAATPLAPTTPGEVSPAMPPAAAADVLDKLGGIRSLNAVKGFGVGATPPEVPPEIAAQGDVTGHIMNVGGLEWPGETPANSGETPTPAGETAAEAAEIPSETPSETPGETAAPEPATPRLRTIDQIMQEEGVGRKKAAAIQAQEVDALPNARPVTAEEVGARKAGVKTPPASPYVKVPPEPKRLIQFLKEKTVIGEGINQTTIPGGIRDDSGDILHLVGDYRTHPGLINNRTGRTLDDATLRAYEEGYFPNHSERPSIDDLLQAIGEDHRNNRQYSSQDMDRVTAYQNAVAHNAEIDRLESETGISPKGMTHDQFMQAVSDHYGQFPGDLPEGSGTGPEPTEWVTTADGEEIPWNERKLPLPPPEGGDLFGGQKAAPVARVPEPTIRTDPRQAVMPGMEGSAVQAQAARDAVPNVGRVPQVKPDEGLFARAETVQPELAAKPIGGNLGRQFQEDTRGSDQHPLMQAADWVFRRGREDGNERLVGIDMHTEQPIFAHGVGERNFVTTPEEGLRAMTEPGAAIAFIHNHPSGSPLSLQDLQMAAHPGVAQVVAVGGDAEFSAARVRPEFLGQFANRYAAASGVMRVWDAASRRIASSLVAAIRSGKLDQPSAERLLHDGILRALHSEGVIDYTSSVHVPHGEMHLADTNASIFSGHALVASPAEGIARVRERAAKVALERRPQGAAGDQAGQATSGVAGSARPDQGALGFAEHQPSLDLPPPAPIEDGQDFESRLSRVRVIGPALASVFHRVAGPETTGAQLLDAVRPWTEGVKKAAAPMAMGGRFESVALEARAQAKNYQNLIEYIHRIGRDGTAYLGKTFDRPSLARMFNAMEAEHQAELNGTEAGAEGIAGLSEPERQAVHAVRETTRRTAAEAQSLGMLPPKITSWYVPHDVAGLGEGDPNKVRVVRDLRAVMLKTMKLQEAIAGRRLINAIRDSGVSAGIEAVREGSSTGRPLNPFGSEFSTTTGNLNKRKYQTIEETEAAARQLPQRASDYFTIPENAAFWRWRVNGQDAEGEPTWERVPIQVHQAWEGPLRSIMWKPTGLAAPFLDLKRRAMTTILYGVSHLGVVASRAIAVSPRIIHMSMEGHAAQADPDLLRQAYSEGLRLIGHRPGPMGVSSFDEPEVEAGRSWTAKGIGAAAKMVGGEGAGQRARELVDKAGDFAHGTLVWDRVADLQMGLYQLGRRQLIAQGLPPEVAGRTAADRANLFVGALPKEAMSQNATILANLAMFSRTYRFASAGILKRAVMGLPRDVQAQIYRDPDTRAFLGMANHAARKEALLALAREVAYAYVGNSLLQSGIAVLQGRGNQEDQTWWGRFAHNFHDIAENPAKALNPFAVLGDLIDAAPMAGNEPGKTNRVLIGHGERGTALYARMPFGKTVSDTVGLLFHPLQSAQSMASPYVHAAMSLGQHNEWGNLIRDPTASVPEAAAQAAANLVGGIFRSFTPGTSLSAFYDLVTNGQEGRARDLAQIIGGGLGVSVSRGFPGGPAMGEVNAARQHHSYVLGAARGHALALFKQGDQQGAAAALQAAGETPAGIRGTFRRWANPGRLTPGMVRGVHRYGTPQQAGALDQDIQDAQHP